MGSSMISSCLVVSQWLKTWREIEILEIPIISIIHTKPLSGKINFATVSEANIWFSYFKLNVSEVDMVNFAEACLFSAREEGEAKFKITLYDPF